MIGYRAPLLPLALVTTAAPPPVDNLPYQGDTAIYDAGGATGGISGGTLLSGDTLYDQTGSTGTVTGGTLLPSDATYDQTGATGSTSGATVLPPEAQR